MTIRSLPFRTRILRRGKSGAASRPGKESGIALITTLLLLILVSILGLAMAVTTNSDMMINGYYGSFRGSFYAADSGLNIARAQLANNLSGQVTMTACTGWVTGSPAAGCTSAPMPTNAGSTALSNLTSNYGSFTSLNAGQAANSWMGSFVIANNGSCTNSVALAPGFPTTAQNAQGQNNSYTYQYNYTLCSVGRAQNTQQAATQETGSVTINILAQTSSSQNVTVSFSAFGAFINNFSQCSGALVYGTKTGPAFTNGQWNFGSGGSYIFTDPVGQHATTADYMFSGGFGGPSCGGVSGCDCQAASSDSYGAQTIAPTFQAGFNLNQPAVALPSNDFSQQWAVLDGVGCGEGGSTCGSSTPPAPTSTGAGNDLSNHLKNISGTSWPTTGSPPSSGVYLPYCTGGTGCAAANKMNGGGMYVVGNAGIALSLGTDSGGHPTQTYQITQGSSPATVTTVTLNINANTTTISQTGPSAGPLTLTGVPMNLAASTATEGMMLYVNGTITSLSGPGQGQASLQDYYATTISANGSIDVTGDLIYNHEPVTLTTADTLIPANNFNQVLGLYTANGDIVYSSSYSNKNLEIDASLAAINSSCTASSSSSICGFATNGHVDTLTIVGGRIESNAHSVSLNTENTYFDRRFGQAGFAPPWFPSTTLPQSDITNAGTPLVTASQPQRLSWVTYPQ